MHAEERLTEPALPTDPSDLKKSDKPPLVSEGFQAIVRVEGRYTAQEDIPTQGTLITSDGIEFPAFLSRVKLREQLAQKYGILQPGQPFPEHAIVWTAYPKLLKQGLTLTIIGVRSSPPSEPLQLKVQGVLIRQSEDGFRLRVYRNLGKVQTANLTDYSDLEFRGQLPQKSKLGWTYRVLAHREGAEFVVDTIEPIHIAYGRQVKGAISHFFNPPPRPIQKTLRQEAKLEEDLGAPPSIKPPPLTEATRAAQTSPDRAILETPQLAVPSSTSSEPVVAPRLEQAPPKRQPAASPGIEPVELVPGEDPQPEPSTIKITASTEPLVVVTSAPAVSAPQSKKKKQAPAATPAAKVPAENKPEPAQRLEPKFLVQVDRQTFGGQTSVVLKTGMLFIDGKQVVRTKLAIVVGEAQTISADGKTQKSGNRTILSSR